MPDLLRVGSDDYPCGIEVVIERVPLAKEFRGEMDVLRAELLPRVLGESDGKRALHHDFSVGCELQSLLNHRIDRVNIEVVELRIIVGRGCDDYQLRVLHGSLRL